MKKNPSRTIEVTGWDAWYKKLITQYTVPSVKEERELLLLAFNGDEKAKEEIVLRNLRLVISVAQKNMSRFRPGTPLSDIVQAGNLGLLDAIRKFNPKYKTRFSTYAGYHIQKYFFELIQSDQLIRIPADMNRKMRNFLSTREALRAKFGREATIREIAEALGTSIKRAQKLETLSWRATSFDGDGVHLSHYVHDNSPSPLDVLLRDEAETMLQVALSEIDGKSLTYLKEYLEVRRFKDAARELRERYNLKNFSVANGKAALVRKKIYALFKDMGASAEHLFP